MTEIIRNDDYSTIEMHFGMPGHAILANTRNKCSVNLVNMIQEVAEILYPEDEIEIYLLPSQEGSYRDTIKFVKKHKLGTAVGSIVALGGLTVAILTYKDSHEAHVHAREGWVLEDTQKRLNLKEKLSQLQIDYEVAGIEEDKIKQICGNLNLKKRKNEIYSVLQKDESIESQEFILRNNEEVLIYQNTIPKSDFSNYIEPVPLDPRVLLEDREGSIELISPVVRQEKNGKGVPWKGVYYGDDIKIHSIPVLSNGDRFEFYMQDQDFKEKMYNKEVSFTTGDNMQVIFDIRVELGTSTVLKRNVYVKFVKNHNENIIIHKVREQRKEDGIPDNQQSLFDI